MKKMIVISAAFLLMSWQSSLRAETTYYVQSMKAQIMSAPSFNSAVLGEVDRGFEFLSSKTAEGWVKVRYNKQEGYVPSLVLLTHPPFESITAITGHEREKQKGFRRRVSSYTQETGRGPAPAVESGQDRHEKADYASLEKIEAFTMSSWEVKRFLQGRVR